MEPAELAESVEAVIRMATARVGPDSIGAQQYHTPGEPQKFEVINIGKMIEMYQEELLDIINYAVMTLIKMDRMVQDLTQIEQIVKEFQDAGSPDLPGVVVAGSERPDGVPSGPGTFVPVTDL